MRLAKVKTLVDRHFALCRKHQDVALDGTPLAAAIRYSLNQEQHMEANAQQRAKWVEQWRGSMSS